jgi:pimeloyl-ACP methyl ester carboxylesterase
MRAAYQYLGRPVPEKYVRVDGVATHLLHVGRTTLPDVAPDTSRGEALLCLHGSGGSAAHFAPLLERLAAAHSPLAFSQPGHARSAGLDSLGSVERMAAFTSALVGKLGLRPPVLVGNSLGGAVALEYALGWPQATRALVLLGSAARFSMLPDELVHETRRVVEGKARRRFDRSGYSPATPDEVVMRGWAEDAKTDPRVVLGDLLAARAWDALPRLGAVSVPALVMVGEDEYPPLREQAEVLASGIPRARQVVIPRAGHMAHFEQPDAVAEAVCGFLAELPA